MNMDWPDTYDSRLNEGVRKLCIKQKKKPNRIRQLQDVVRWEEYEKTEYPKWIENTHNAAHSPYVPYYARPFYYLSKARRWRHPKLISSGGLKGRWYEAKSYDD
jgi:hypothetical protein